MIGILKKITPQFFKNIFHMLTWKKTKRDRIKFGFDIVKHCNLNCKGCDHFSCLAKEEFADKEAIRKDLIRMEKIFGDNIEQISILGGEPLLNPDIIYYCVMTRSIFPTSNITIITNGTLLLKMKDEFWDCCRVNKIVISATKYPVDFDYDKVEALAKDKDVMFRYQGDGTTVKSMYCVPIDEKGTQNPQRSFNMCLKGNGCITLENGHLYPCTLIPNIRIFNEHFGKNITIAEEDGIDIYSDVTAEEVLERLAAPVPFCKYCNQLRFRNGIKWETTSKDISEWT